ncbi:MAG: sugar phosphate nucleotidyltransferase [Microgenomates group bacterium]|nr:sugar phosphate nucleotidyltransferase [Microgenomates group bacterium]
MNKNIAAIILAAGKGTRMKCKERNKVTIPFLNKPLIVYAVELMINIASPVVVVAGAFKESVRQVLKKYPVVYAFQKKRLGTGHAVKVGLSAIAKLKTVPELILVGYGDHMMFYDQEVIKKLLDLHQKKQPAISLITFEYDRPNLLKYGRIIRDKNGFITGIVEQKNASPKQKLIKEVNPGFYCFDYLFLKKYLNQIRKSAVGEYYLTDLVEIAAAHNFKTIGLKIPFEKAGLGINTFEELKESEKIYIKKNGH